MYFECYDTQRNSTVVCLLEVGQAKQIFFEKGQIVSSPEIMFFLNQIVVIEGYYSKEDKQFECEKVYQGTCYLYSMY